MKILYLDLNVQYHNPTRNNIPLLLKNFSDLIIYGPGYQESTVLEEGVEKFYQENGPFDFIITNEHFVFRKQQNIDEISNGFMTYNNNYFYQFNIKEIGKIIRNMTQFFHNDVITSKKIVCLMESDYYNFNLEQIDKLNNLYIIGWGKDLVAHTEVLKDLTKETFGDMANNNWFDFVQDNNKIIQMPHFVNSNEFYFECLDNRKNSVYVAGVNYYHRKKAMDILKKSSYKVDDKKYYNKVYSLMRKLKIKPDAHPVLMRLYNILFRNELEQNKYVFTCGSGLEWPIRKFFEIPAIGSVLLAKPFYNAEKLGFVDGENYIKTDYKDIVEKIDWLENNPKEAQEIAKNGQDIIWEKHSLDARAKQLKQCLEAIIIDEFNGTYWNNGEFHILERKICKC